MTETFRELSDTLCVGQRREEDNDERVLLLVKIRSGLLVTEEMKQRLRIAIRQRYTPRHLPRYILEVADIPYTVNGKRSARSMSRILSVAERRLSVGRWRTPRR